MVIKQARAIWTCVRSRFCSAGSALSSSVGEKAARTMPAMLRGLPGGALAGCGMRRAVRTAMSHATTAARPSAPIAIISATAMRDLR
jgi:hypothetical protein